MELPIHSARHEETMLYEKENTRKFRMVDDYIFFNLKGTISQIFQHNVDLGVSEN